jgi:hypothetical protein
MGDVMDRIRLFFAFSLATAGAAFAGDQEASREQVHQELAAARQAHPAFDQYARAAFAQARAYPRLTIEQAFCIVSRGQVEDPACAGPLADALVVALRPLVPLKSVPLMEEGPAGEVAPARDAAGLPIFESPAVTGNGLLGPYRRNAYGLGMHSDATGRPFTFRTQDGEDVGGRVKVDAYGPGVHMDTFGRPVFAVPQ